MGRKAKLKKRRKHIRQQQYKVVNAYYNRNPDIFIEDYTGVKLKWYERKWIRFKSKVGDWFAKRKHW